MDARPIADPISTLRDLVVQRLRSAIVSGRSAPGTLFSVPTLGKEFGVSSTPVREALLELARDGLVTAERNRRSRVVMLISLILASPPNTGGEQIT